MLGSDTLLGVDDPLAGMLTEEITRAWQISRVALKSKGYISESGEGVIAIDPAAAGLLGTWALPEAYVIATYSQDSRPVLSRHYFMTRHLAVRRISIENGYYLEAVRPDEIHAEIRAMFGLVGQPAAPGTQVRLPEPVFSRGRQMAAQRGADAAYTLLSESTDEPGDTLTTLSALSATLAGPHASGSVTAMSKQATTWEVSGLGLLEGPQGLWRLRSFTRDSRNWVEAIPCDAMTLGAEIRKAVNRVLPDSEH